MDTLRLLRARLDELLSAQPPDVREIAQLIFQIPEIIDSQVYGFVLRAPQALITFIRSQARLAGHDLPVEESPDNNLLSQVNELRTFIHIHLRRINSDEDPRYSLISRLPEGFVLPGESQDLEFAAAFLTTARTLGYTLPNMPDNLVFFARALLSAIGRARPDFLQLIRDSESHAFAVAWFVISFYTGSPDMCNYSAMIITDPTSEEPIFGSVAYTLASAIRDGTLGDIGDVAKLFRRTPVVNATPSLTLPPFFELILSSDLWCGLTLGEQAIVSLLGNRIIQENPVLLNKVCQFQDAFFTYCRQIAVGSFDSSAFQASDEVELTVDLLNFILSMPGLQESIEGVRFLHDLDSPPRAGETRPVDVLEWNTGLFALWRERFGHDDDGAIGMMTDRLISHELLEMAAASRLIDVGVLATQQIRDDPTEATSFPGFTGPEESENTDEKEQDFDDVCLFCVTRLCDPGQSGGEKVHLLSCCGKRVGAVCLQAYTRGSSSCPFCSQAL